LAGGGGELLFETVFNGRRHLPQDFRSFKAILLRPKTE